MLSAGEEALTFDPPLILRQGLLRSLVTGKMDASKGKANRIGADCLYHGRKEITMSQPRCGSCAFRARYDKNPRSILGRLWRWHIGFCPGWKAYMTSLPEDEKSKIMAQYNIKTKK
jgi:hypothetical protein